MLQVYASTVHFRARARRLSILFKMHPGKVNTRRSCCGIGNELGESWVHSVA